MKVEEIMNTPVVFTQKTRTVSSLKDMLSRKRINAVPVIEDEGGIAGIVSSSNIIACHDETLLVQDVMTDFIHVISPNNRVIDAAKIMVKHGIHHLVVMEEGNVIGMLSSMDIFKTFAAQD